VDSAESYFDGDAKSFDGGGQVVMDRYRAFRALAYVRTLISMDQNDAAVEVAIQELGATLRPEPRLILGTTLRSVFRKTILDDLAAGNSYEALSFFHDRYSSLPKELGAFDNEYLLKLAQAAADLGLGGMAKEIVEIYRGVAGERDRSVASVNSAGSPAAGGRSQNSKASEADFEKRRMASDRQYTEARALWSASGLGAADGIRGYLSEMTEESEHSCEREILLGLLDEKEQRYDSALKHGLRAQLLLPPGAGAPESGDADRFRLGSWIAGLQARTGNLAAANDSYAKMIRSLSSGPAAKSGAIPESHRTEMLPPVLSRLDMVLGRGEVLQKLGRWQESASVYADYLAEGASGSSPDRLLASAEGGASQTPSPKTPPAVALQPGHNRVLYEYARALEKSPKATDHRKSSEAYRQLAASKIDDFWKTLGQQSLEGGSGEGPGVKSKLPPQ